MALTAASRRRAPIPGRQGLNMTSTSGSSPLPAEDHRYDPISELVQFIEQADNGVLDAAELDAGAGKVDAALAAFGKAVGRVTERLLALLNVSRGVRKGGWEDADLRLAAFLVRQVEDVRRALGKIGPPKERVVAEREELTETGLGSTARCCGRRRHRQANSVRVCSPTSRRVASLRPRSAGLTALTPAPRTLVQIGSCRRCSLIHPLHVVVDVPSRMTLFRATADTGRCAAHRGRRNQGGPGVGRAAVAADPRDARVARRIGPAGRGARQGARGAAAGDDVG